MFSEWLVVGKLHIYIEKTYHHVQYRHNSLTIYKVQQDRYINGNRRSVQRAKGMEIPFTELQSVWSTWTLVIIKCDSL